MTGIIFDQLYTDSLLRTSLPRGTYRAKFKLRTRPPLQDTLLSLVLFGRAYLQRPFWLDEFDYTAALSQLFSEDLIEFLAEDVYQSTFIQLGTLLNLRSRARLADITGLAVEYDPVADRVRFDRSADVDREIRTSDLEHDAEVILRRFLYVEPLIRAGVQHFGQSGLALREELDPGLHMSGFAAPLQMTEESSVGDLIDYIDSFFACSDPFDAIEAVHINTSTFSKGEAAAAQKSLARDAQVFLSTILTGGTAACAATKDLPIKTASQGRGGRIDRTRGDGAYQLFKVQFENLRYPVLENIGDVLRLRDDPNLGRYRDVMSEYSELLEGAAEQASRVKLLGNFKDDLQKASLEWRVRERRSTVISTFMFFLSFPLAVIGLLAPIKLGLAFMPASIYARAYSAKYKKDFGWVAFGRSQ